MSSSCRSDPAGSARCRTPRCARRGCWPSGTPAWPSRRLGRDAATCPGRTRPPASSRRGRRGRPRPHRPRRTTAASPPRRARPGSAGLVARTAVPKASGRAAARQAARGTRVGGRGLEVTWRGAGLGDDCAGGARRARFLGRDLAEGLDELVYAAVAGLVDLELIAPGLHRDRLVEARERAHPHEVVALDLLGQLVDFGLGQVRPVGDPDRTVLHAVHRVLVCDGGRVDVALAALPVGIVGAPHRGQVIVFDHAVLVLLVLEHLRVGLAVVLDPGDRGGPVRPGLVVLIDLVAAEADDAQRQRADEPEERDGSPVATLVDLDRRDRLTGALAASARPGTLRRASLGALGGRTRLDALGGRTALGGRASLGALGGRTGFLRRAA